MESAPFCVQQVRNAEQVAERETTATSDDKDVVPACRLSLSSQPHRVRGRQQPESEARLSTATTRFHCVEELGHQTGLSPTWPLKNPSGEGNHEGRDHFPARGLATMELLQGRSRRVLSTKPGPAFSRREAGPRGLVRGPGGTLTAASLAALHQSGRLLSGIGTWGTIGPWRGASALSTSFLGRLSATRAR